MESTKESRLKTVVRYSTLAASITRDIAGSVKVPFLASVATLTLAILNAVQSAKTNKEECVRMLENIHDVLCFIINFHEISKDDVHSPAFLYDVANFAQTLQKIYAFLQRQQSIGTFKRLFKQIENTSQLDACNKELQHAMEVFRTRCGVSAVMQLSEMRAETERKHKDLLKILSSYAIPTNEGHSPYMNNDSLSTLGNSSGNLSLLPTSPQIFHGRELELRDLLDTLKQDSARVAILGMGGIGKTSLATAALHHIDVTTKYTRRYFVSCATVTTHRELISNIGSHLGLDQSSNLAKKIIRELSASFSSLLILDNLETPWEPPSSREEVEDFLSLLSDVSNLAIVITMRGAERPGKVKWTRPFLGPLKPLENSAALKTFADIADVDEVNETEHIAELLKLTDNLPLAVNLIANVASYEGCSVTLARWKEEKTNLLSEGHDKRSSLDISIMLSVTSPRVVSTPGAQDLLSVLSILPDGLSDIDLLQSNLPIPNILKAKSGLIRTSLAYTDRDQRVKVLNPIREYVRTVYPPSVSATRPLRQHFHNLVKLWVNFGQLESKNIIYRTTANLANLNSLLLEGLQSNPPDIEDSIRCIFSLNYFCTATSRGLSPLMSQVPSLLDRLDNRQLLGLYLIELFNSVYVQRIFDPAAAIRQGDQYFENSTVLEQAQWHNALGLYYSSQGKDITRALQCYKTALSLSTEIQDLTQQSLSLRRLATIEVGMGNYDEATVHAREGRRCAEHMCNIPGQASAIRIEAWCSSSRGDFSHAARLYAEARDLLSACGLQWGDVDRLLMIAEAEIHLLKTEYAESRAINAAIVQSHSDQISSGSQARAVDRNVSFALINVAITDIAIDGVAREESIRKNLDTARQNFTTLTPYPQGVLYCNMGLADLELCKGNTRTARALFGDSLFACRGSDDDGCMFSLERLAAISSAMDALPDVLGWAGVFFALAQKTRNRLATHKALQCFGDIFLALEDDATALNLFSVALDGFKAMGVHRNQGVCLVRLADIYERHGDCAQSVELRKAARPFFERSSKTRDLANLNVEIESLDSSNPTS